ncbi:MAG: hypothetical protein ACOYL5_20735 [Phototrophicaceae bacterium]|jgi:hypothetical protein
MPEKDYPQDAAAALERLEALFAEQSVKIAESLLDGLDKAPLNQRASALGMLFDRLQKLEARHSAADPNAIGGIEIHYTGDDDADAD